MTAEREQAPRLSPPSVNARLIHHAEAAALLIALVALAVWQRDQLTPWLFWALLVAPDLFGYVPASFMGSRSEQGALPPRGVPLYNLWHTTLVPLGIGAALLAGTGEVPWWLLGWFIHVTADRAMGFGSRAADGRQALRWTPAARPRSVAANAGPA